MFILFDVGLFTRRRKNFELPGEPRREDRVDDAKTSEQRKVDKRLDGTRIVCQELDT
jgi:hypothetical protein